MSHCIAKRSPVLGRGLVATIGHVAAAEDTLIHAGRLLADPASGRVLTEQTIVVRDGRVAEIRAGFVSGAGRVIDLRNKFVLPGLIDSHVHLCHENGPDDRMNRVTKTAADWAVQGARFAAVTLRAGFTTVANLGDENEAIFALRDGIAAGRCSRAASIGSGQCPEPSWR